MTKIFNIIAVFLILNSLGIYLLFKQTKNDIVEVGHNSQITYVKEISKNISDYIKKHIKNGNIYVTLKKDDELRNHVEIILQNFITQRYRYFYILDLENKEKTNFRFLLDGAKNLSEKSEFGEFYEPINQDRYMEVYRYKKPIYFKHKADEIDSLWMTYLYPIIVDDKVQAIIVTDFSTKEHKIILNSLENFDSFFKLTLLFFILIFVVILWFAYIDKKREKEKDIAYKKLKLTSDKLQEQTDKITNLNNTLELRVEEEVRKNQEKDKEILQQRKQAQMGEMIGMIAHQWRQPLNAISATSINLSLMSSMGTLHDDKIQKDCSFIEQQCQKMSETIDTFMNFVKPSSESKKFNLSNAIENSMQIIGTQLKNHNIDVKINYKDVEVEGKEDLLEQVILNILSNARDAFLDQVDNNDKFIHIDIDIKDEVPIISIEDNAGGIPEDIQDKIFNPYFTTKEQGKGTGIGLYMSLDIMQKSFLGDLKYTRTQNGSKFDIIFKK